MDKLNKYIDEEIVLSILRFIENMDNQLFKSKSKYLMSKGYKKRKIYLRGFLVEIKRRYYYDFVNKKYRFLLDENLELIRFQIFSKQIQLKIQELIFIDRCKFKDIIKQFNFNISKATISRILKRNLGLIYRNNIENSKSYNNIYIDIDDTFRNLKVKNKKEKFRFRIIHFYQNYNKQTKNFVNETKCVLVSKINNYKYKNSTILTLDFIKDIIKKLYGNLDQFNIFIAGDGAKNLKQIAKQLETKYYLDKWHLFHKNKTVFNISNLKRDLNNKQKSFSLREQKRYFSFNIKQHLKIGEMNKVNQLLDMAKINFRSFPYKVKQISNYQKYISNNKSFIECWQSKNYFGCYTETFVQQLVKSRFGDVGKIYSYSTFINILSAKSIVFEM